MLWSDKNLGFYDGKVPVDELAKAPALESVSFTFVPSPDVIGAINDAVLTTHPDVALRFYRLPKAIDLSVLAGLGRIRRLALEVQPKALDFIASLRELRQFHTGLKRASASKVGNVKKLDLTKLPGLQKLKRVSLPPRIANAVGGKLALEAFEQRKRDLYITDFRAEVKRELDLDSPYI
jgi:hypothetical protein